MKTALFIINVIAIFVTAIALLVGLAGNDDGIIYGMIFLFFLGALQMICVIVLAAMWGRLAAATKRIFRTYLITLGVYGGVSMVVYSIGMNGITGGMIDDWVAIAWVGVIPFIMAILFTYVTYVHSKHEEAPKGWQGDVLDQGL
ncbi:MAG: hypothetical protein JNM00_04620 [Flavobacteriales bacterium]|nr:hypothetical protein [Flavobacteriales bacterium]